MNKTIIIQGCRKDGRQATYHPFAAPHELFADNFTGKEISGIDMLSFLDDGIRPASESPSRRILDQDVDQLIWAQ